MRFSLGMGHLIMQSVNSLGPMINIMALFGLVSSYAGLFQPIIVLAAFMLSYLNIIAIYWLSRIFTSNGGYYTFSGKVFGPYAGMFTALLYLTYSIP
ncbi:MAG: APC family permease, partial [Thermoplasmataceae archaeon]